MGSLFHIAEVAALLLVAYALGWSIGFLLHLAVRPRAKAEAIPAERLAVAMGEAAPADALVKAPVIVEVEKTPPPVKVAASALETPQPADQAVLAEAPAPAVEPVLPVAPPGPKLSAIETLRSLSSAMPLLPGELKAAVAPQSVAVEPVAPLPAVEPEPAPEPVSDPVAAVPAAEVAAAVAEITAAVIEAPRPAAPQPVAPVSVPPPAEADVAVAPPAPASVPGQAWSGRIHGHEAPPLAAAAELTAEPPRPLGATVPPAPEPDPQPLAAEMPAEVLQQEAVAPKPLVVEEPVGLEASLLSIVEAHLPPEPAAPESVIDPAIENALLASVAGGLAIDAEAEAALTTPAPAEAAAPEPVAEQPVAPHPAEPEPEPALSAPEPVVVTAPPEPPYIQAPVEFDESAAMRDIEGGWSRRRTRAMTDASDVGAAVAAAQMAVENVLARNGVSADRQAGKPKGLPGPRDGRRDNLRQINGLSPLDESTLNNLGVFHFEQVAAWSAAEVLWLENHAFARGRIGQENWQQQAGVLAGEITARRAAR